MARVGLLAPRAGQARWPGAARRLARWLDDPATDDGRAIDAEDAGVSSPRGRAEGIEEVLAYVRRNSSDDEHTQHLTTDVTVDLAGDRAVVRANQLVYFYRPGAAPHRTSGIRHRFEAARTPDGWRLASADVELAWMAKS